MPVDTVAYSYGDANWKDLLTAYDGQSITYDAIGNPLTYRDGMSMTWSGRNLTGLTKDGQSISYTYDANGLRASKTVDGNTTTYYTSGGVKIGEYRAGTNTDVFYMHDEKGTIYGICINGTTYLFVYNAQGDVIALYDNAGNVHARYTYDAWGRPISITDGSGNDVSGNPSYVANINPFRYRNYYYDTETGFYYLNSRYYDPQTGRFVNPDGYVSTGQGLLGFNMFAYCGNNPVSRSDPSGHFWQEFWESLTSTFNQWAPAYQACQNIAMSDGPLPVADVLAIGGAVLITLAAVGVAAYQTTKTPSRTSSKITEKDKDIVGPRQSPTVIYRYGGTNPGSLTPSQHDVDLFPETRKGLSFSTIPPRPGQKAAVTTMEAINATGVVYAVQDGVNHVSIHPIGGTLEDWHNAGASSVWTTAVKSVVVKWDGGN